jgi:beta-lactamase regulating signal transducer with metallopeptidase domain
MSLMLVVEAAARSAVMALIIWLALSLLRIRQVRAQRAAWLTALCGALIMPLLTGLQIGPGLLPAAAVAPADLVALSAGSLDAHAMLPVAVFLAGIYLAVSTVLLLRLALGLAAALRIRRRAAPIDSGVDSRLDIRVSGCVFAPVTIGSSIVLPRSYAEWPKDRLRIVLGHESAHVRQRDFDVQLLAGLHCALFWFSPFSWWLRRQLADLGEALSDHAAVQHAASRASYAELLLAFAAGSATTSLPSAAVAMARSSNLSARIERLLSDGFHQCFATRPRTLLAAAGVAALALAAATSVPRAQAAATHGFVHSDETFAGNEANAPRDIGASEAAPPAQASLETLSADIPATPAVPSAPAAPSAPPPPPAAPPAPAATHAASHAEAIDNYAREMVRAQRELTRQAQRLARQGSESSAELEHEWSQVGAELGRAQQQMAAAQKELASKMQSAQMKALREQQSKLGEQMGKLAEQQLQLIEQAMQAFNATLEKAVHEGLAALPET